MPDDRARDVTDWLLEVRGLTKRFGDLVACDGVDLHLARGEIHALLGENGAGKSTLVKMLYGSLEPDAGDIYWDGAPVRINSPAEARAAGIGMVFQHFSLFEALTVRENIALALPPRKTDRTLGEKIYRVSREYGLPLDPDSSIADLSVGERQRVEIVRCLLQEPRLIIMDEPTSVLTPQEADILFDTLKKLTAEGVAILYISHRLAEVLAIAARATILRHGKIVGEADPCVETAASLANMMVGGEVSGIQRSQTNVPESRPRLELAELSIPATGPFSVALQGIKLEVAAGEIVCIAGVAGNGQGELFDALSGEISANRPDSIRVDGEPCGALSVTERRRRGAAFVPEERLGHGAVPEFRLTDNVILTRHSTSDAVVRSSFIDRRAARQIKKRVVDDFDVRMSLENPEARSLSGGNLQKFVVGRELDRKPGVIVINQPTWGVDAGAASLIRQALVDLARSGSAVLVISQDLDEIFEIADRIAVISRGHLSPAVPADSATRESVGLLMGGLGEPGDENGGAPDSTQPDSNEGASGNAA